MDSSPTRADSAIATLTETKPKDLGDVGAEIDSKHTHHVSFWRWLGRAFISFWLLLVVALGSAIAGYLANIAPKLLDPWLGPTVLWWRSLQVGEQALYVVVAFFIAIALVRLTYIAWVIRESESSTRRRSEVTELANAFSVVVDKKFDVPLSTLLEITERIDATTKQTDVKVTTLIEERLRSSASSAFAGVHGASFPVRKLVGRSEQVAHLINQIKNADVVASNVVALEGMPGVGKTVLAAEVVSQLAEDVTFPGGAVWIYARGLSGEEGLLEVMERVLLTLRPSYDMNITDTNTLRTAVRSEIASRPFTLIAVDNVDIGLDERALGDTLAIPEHSILLITSRYTLAPERFIPVKVRPLSDESARELFVQHLRLRDAERPYAWEEDLLAGLVKLTGNLPLAIELVASYCGVQRLQLLTVIDQLQQLGLEAPAFTDATYQEHALIATFGSSWRVLTPTQQMTFMGLSLLAETSFPRRAAVALAHAAWQRVGDRVGHSDANAETDVAALVSYSLTDPLANERLSLHPLLREFASEMLMQMAQGESMKDIIDVLADASLSFWSDFARANGADVHGPLLNVAPDDIIGIQLALNWAEQQGREQTFWEIVRQTTVNEAAGPNFSAYCMCVPGVAATGMSKEEAFQKLREAITAHRTSFRE